MRDDVSFHRIGARPGSKPDLAPMPWQSTDVPVSEGMAPRGLNYYADRGGKMTAGIWVCDAGNIEIRDNRVEEVCFVLRGTVTVTDGQGRSDTFGSGECFVLPRGFDGVVSQSNGFAKLRVTVT